MFTPQSVFLKVDQHQAVQQFRSSFLREISKRPLWPLLASQQRLQHSENNVVLRGTQTCNAFCHAAFHKRTRVSSPPGAETHIPARAVRTWWRSQHRTLAVSGPPGWEGTSGLEQRTLALRRAATNEPPHLLLVHPGSQDSDFSWLNYTKGTCKTRRKHLKRLNAIDL